MEVILFLPQLEPQARLRWTTLEALFEADDGLAEEEEAIRQALARPGGFYTGGGGAAPVFFIRPATPGGLQP